MKHSYSYMRLLPAAVMAVALASWLGANAYNEADWDAEAARRKAGYIFMEAQDAYEQDEFDRHVVLTVRAYQLDSADLDIAYGWGKMVMAVNPDDSLRTAKAYEYSKRRFYTDPTNYLTGLIVSNMASSRRDVAEYVRIWETLDSARPDLNQTVERLAHAYLIASGTGDSTAYDKALAIYDRMERGNGKSIDLSSRRIQAYALHGDSAGIAAEVESLVAFAPDDPNVEMFAGANYQYLGDNEKALAYFDKACRLDSTNGQAFMAKANIYLQMGDSARYDREVFQALQSPNLEVEPKLDILHSYVSKLYSDRSQEPRIRKLFGTLENMHSGEARIHDLYSAYLYEIGDKPGAAEQLTYSVALEPANQDVWVTLVQMLMQAEDKQNALKYSLDAKGRFPDNLYFPLAAADVYRADDRVDEAVQVLESVEIDNPANHKAVSSFVAFKGDLYALKGDTALALKLYDEAIDMDHDNNMALNNAAYFMACNGIELDKAEQYIARVMNSEGDNATYLDTYAWVAFKKGDYSLAKQYIDMTFNIYKGGASDQSDSTAVDIGLLDNDGEESDADNSYVEEVVEIGDEAPLNGADTPTGVPADVYEHAGDIYFKNDEKDAAIQFWKKALELDPDNKRLARKVEQGAYLE